MLDLVDNGKAASNSETGPNESTSDTDLLVAMDSRLACADLELLKKMQEMNRTNEQDDRSVVSSAITRSQVSLCKNGASQDDESQMEEDLLSAWGDLVKNWVGEYNSRPEYVRALVRRGIPYHFRSIAWQLLTNADMESARELYPKYGRMRSICESQIRHCITRCHGVKRSSSNFNIIKAWVLHERVAWCPQEGMVYVVHRLLSQMPEFEAFAVLIQLMSEKGLRELYDPSMARVALRVYQLEHLIQDLLPNLYAHLRNIDFDSTTYASSWFLSFYESHLSPELSNRIMDVFICEGIDVVFRLALASLLICERDLRQLDAEGVVRYLRFDMAQKLDQDHDLVMNTVAEILVEPERMKELENDFVTKSQVENEDDDDDDVIELRKLRIANGLLRQRITRLEDESALLADELSAVETKESEVSPIEDGPEIRKELNHLRQVNADIHMRLEEAYQTIKELTGEGAAGTEDKEVQADDTPTIEHIHMLQEEVMEARARDSDYVAVTKDLRIRARELELANEKLKSEPSDACLNDLKQELAEIQARESEANRMLKETRQKIKALHEDWEVYISKQPQSTDGPVTYEEIHQQIMGAWIREADALAELKETRQRVMELETQNHVFENQMRRQDEEYKTLQWRVDTWPSTERELQCSIRETQHKLRDAEARQKEEAVLARLKEAELLETITDLKSQMLDMESSYFEKWTQGELSKDHLDDDDDDDDEDTDEADEAEKDDIDSSYHSSDTITEEDFDNSVTRHVRSKRHQEMKKRRYEAHGAPAIAEAHA